MLEKIRILVAEVSNKAAYNYEVVFKKLLEQQYGIGSDRKRISLLIKKQLTMLKINEVEINSLLDDELMGDEQWLSQFKSNVLDIFVDEILLNECTS